MADRYVSFESLPTEVPAPPTAEEVADIYASGVVKRAESYIGVREKGRNRGPIIDRALAFVGVTEPAPWCTAIAVAIQHEGAADMGFKSTCPKVASGAKLWRWAMKHPEAATIFSDFSSLRAGDIGIKGRTVLHAARIRAGRLAQGHTWTAATISADGRHGTLEGNTSPAGSREGDGFYRRSRSHEDPTFVGWVRFKAVL